MKIVKLKPSERELILAECDIMEDPILRPIQKAVLLDGWYTFRLDQTWLGDFLCWMDVFAHHADEQEQGIVFQEICTRLDTSVKSHS